jgi:hypothetical protein
MFFGDWLSNERGLRQFFLEIQVKRISGADDRLLESFGISSKHAWMSLHDPEHPGIEPVAYVPLFPATGRPLPTPRALPAPRPKTDETLPTVEQKEHASPAPASSAAMGKPKAVAPQAQATDDRRPVIVSSGSAQSPEKRTPLPNMTNLSIRQQAAADTSPSSPATDSNLPLRLRAAAETSISSPAGPSTQPTATAESDEAAPQSSSTDSASEGSIYLAEGENPFDTLIPAQHQAPASSTSEPHHHYEEDTYERLNSAKRSELARVFAFTEDARYQARKSNSFMYLVRVVAVPDRNDVGNVFTGPPVRHRYGTVLGTGGWVAPPVEDRERWREARGRAVYQGKEARPGRYEGLPAPTAQNAMPMRFDWSGDIYGRYYGPPAPVWRELCEPTLEDVYWMVWQLLAGRQFVGFPEGFGFGVPRHEARGDQVLLAECPFRSPSPEALYHAASYPRGRETEE